MLSLRLLFGTFLRLGEWSRNVIQVRRGSLDALQLGISLAIVIVDIRHRDEGIGLKDQVDGLSFALGVAYRIAESVSGVDISIDRDDLRARSEVRFIGGTSPTDVCDDSSPDKRNPRSTKH